MKKQGILNNDLSKLIAEMGHTDKLVICDAGLPIPSEANRIDLALTEGVPKFIEALAAILDDLVVERAIIAEEMEQESPELFTATMELLGEIPVDKYTHEEFKKLSKQAKGIVRSGEVTPFANIILISGVDF
ncbi:D-ribose pyranase [Sporohalobacter salinus]|uniref:D-ribose pyranase n=1 Tax=Sporohalobacter salinus TaxID=1494606 RepID=UPI001960391B|nr:D-ribose pyranase [Sporohalobacter salinus]